MERLSRGLVAVHQGGGRVFVSWRLLGTDPDGVAFNLYRIVGNAAPVRVNAAPLTEATSASDSIFVTAPVAYLVRPSSTARSSSRASATCCAARRRYLSLPLHTPDGYTPNDASVGDLDGDGEYEIVVHQVGRGRDNSQARHDRPSRSSRPTSSTARSCGGSTSGKNIREGAHYTQFMVYDLDGDGRAEVACKTADGTIDGEGKVIGDASADHRNADGYILDGPEFLTVFDGRTGAALATTDHPPRIRRPRRRRAAVGRSGATHYGNRVDRFLACVAYLDGERPSSSCAAATTRAPCWPPGTGATAS